MKQYNMENKDIIKEFIQNNKLDFTGTGSELNGNCIVLAGFACYLELDLDTLDNIIRSLYEVEDFSKEAIAELCRVFNYAVDKNYGDYWKTDKAKQTYKF